MTELPVAIQHQMAQARPWDHAEDESIWEISGQRPDGERFERCLAMAIPQSITAVDYVVFAYIHPGLTLATRIDRATMPASEVTHARPLLLVHRDEPGTAYWDEDQGWIDGGGP